LMLAAWACAGKARLAPSNRSAAALMVFMSSPVILGFFCNV
jgi:hypothetical protein